MRRSQKPSLAVQRHESCVRGVEASRRCLDKLPRRPGEAMRARLRGGPDGALARALGMRVNTFLQNIVRARKLLAKCLETYGGRLQEHLR